MALCWTVPVAAARSVNGNDFALFMTEASTPAERQALIESAGRRPHYFRYLQIMEMASVREGNREGLRIVALEPASGLDVLFTVLQPVSLAVLHQDPKSVPGRALAVSGVIREADVDAGILRLDPVVVRHKDRLAPVAGKEMLYEFDANGVFYSFTGGGREVRVGYRDRDLLRQRGRIMESGGDRAWADFLARELQQRATARKPESATP